jgi:hypothetical protein
MMLGDWQHSSTGKWLKSDLYNNSLFPQERGEGGKNCKVDLRIGEDSFPPLKN